MGQKYIAPPRPIMLIAAFQFAKAGCLLTVAAFLWLAPDMLPNSQAFTQLLFIAAHGRDLSGFLVPLFGCYVAYTGVRLLYLSPSIRRTLAISSAITICVSLQRLGIFGETSMHSQLDRQTVYILILLDLAVYIYLAFHPEIARTFSRSKKFTS